MYLGIDVGATNIRVGLFQKGISLKLLDTKSFPVSNSFDQSIKNIVNASKELGKGGRLFGVGSTLNGIVDANKGLILDCANLKGWIGKPFAHTLQKQLGVKVRVDNDMVIAALGEYLYGKGKRRDKFMYVVWGTGFGAAFVEKIGKKVKISQIEAGHQILVWDGRKCMCGQKGCAEAYIGGKSAEVLYKQPLSKIKDEKIWDKLAQDAAQALINTLNHYPTDLIVFGGGVINQQQHLLSRITKLINRHMVILETPQLEMAKLGDEVGMYGAAGLFFVEKI